MQFKIDGRGLLMIPDHKIIMGGRFRVEHRRRAWGRYETLSVEEIDNLVVDQGLNHILGTELGGQTQITQWYLGLFQGNYTPVAADTGATIAGNSTECSSYTSPTRPLWQGAAPSGKSITNTANPAIFTFDGSATIYGAFLTSSATIGGTSGTLFAAAQFATPKPVSAPDQLLISYTFNAVSA